MTFPELQVQHDRVARRGLQCRDGVGLGLRMTHYLDMLDRRNGFGEALANDRRVLDEENSQRICRARARL